MTAPPFDLNGRTALITGSSSGLGARFARMLAAQGVNVVAGARRLDRLTVLADEIRAVGGRIEPVEMDVEDEASIIAAYDRAEQAFGVVDTIIANEMEKKLRGSVEPPTPSAERVALLGNDIPRIDSMKFYTEKEEHDHRHLRQGGHRQRYGGRHLGKGLRIREGGVR